MNAEVNSTTLAEGHDSSLTRRTLNVEPTKFEADDARHLTPIPVWATPTTRLERHREQMDTKRRRIEGYSTMITTNQQQHEANQANLAKAVELESMAFEEMASQLHDLEALVIEEQRQEELFEAQARLAQLQAEEDAVRARRSEMKKLQTNIAALNAGKE